MRGGNVDILLGVEFGGGVAFGAGVAGGLVGYPGAGRALDIEFTTTVPTIALTTVTTTAPTTAPKGPPIAPPIEPPNIAAPLIIPDASVRMVGLLRQ